MEQFDIAMAFIKGVMKEQEEGKKNRKIISEDSMKDLFKTTRINPLPLRIRELLIENNVFVRKLRGKKFWGVWWDTHNKHAQGRGVSKR